VDTAARSAGEAETINKKQKLKRPSETEAACFY